MRLIDADIFIEDIKTEIVNLKMDGMLGTPRPTDNLYDLIDRIVQQPTETGLPHIDTENKYFKKYDDYLSKYSDEEIKNFLLQNINSMDRRGYIILNYFIRLNFGIVKKE